MAPIRMPAVLKLLKRPATQAKRVGKLVAGACRTMKEAKTVAKASKLKRSGCHRLSGQHQSNPLLLSDAALERARADAAAAATRAKPAWQVRWPAGVKRTEGPPAWWLPPKWAQGTKTTCRSPLKAYVSPWGKLYYHQCIIEQILGRKLGPGDGVEGARDWARAQLAAGKGWFSKVELEADARLFACLSKAERACLPGVDDFRFCVISARRASVREGIQRIVQVQAQLRAGGASPIWYVDEASLEAYQQLGVRAVVGGRLCEARNRALADAARQGRACVQVSDDISRWVYVKSGEVCQDLFEGNEAAKRADHIRVSPVAAARFLLAKMRAAPGAEPPQLGGVFPLGNTGMSLGREAVSREHFILGDFFVHDRSPVRFDPEMTLKEDYDFTCAHLARHGSVLRCNRLFVHAAHERNAGGACSARDNAGELERENIRLLQQKWPGVFSINGLRGDTQVVLSWRRRRAA